MANKNIAGNIVRSVSAIALALSALSAPAIASAQERGGPGAEFRGPRGGENYRGGGPRSMRMPQGDVPQRMERQRPSAPVSPAAPSVSGGRNSGYGYRNTPSRGYGGEARQTARPGAQVERRTWQGRGDWQNGQRGTYRASPNRGEQRGSGVATDGVRSRSDWRNRQRDGSWGDRDRRPDVVQARPEPRSNDRPGWRNDRPSWQNDRQGWQNGRPAWQNDRRGSDGRQNWRNDSNGSQRWSQGDRRSWDRGWRNDSRYNWSSYRARNRTVFSSGRYYAPYRNYSYRRLSIGFALGSGFYGSRYWINDPYSYRLPEVYGPYRWVRYYDDVLLVDTYTGEVVDAIYDFFW